jgi:chromosomal replication initiator protein
VTQSELPLDPWQRILARLKPTADPEEYEAFLAPTAFSAERDGTLEIRAPSQYVIDEVRERFGHTIRNIAEKLLPSGTQFHFEAEQTAMVEVQKQVALPKPRFIPRYRFENLVVGPSNHLAYAAAISVAGKPGDTINPLFIYGGPGLGKTHLLHAIGQQVMQREPDTRLVCMSAESFVNDFIRSVRHGQMEDFRQRYRRLDFLILDDMEILAGKERTQEEFYHVFNALHEGQKQMVFASNKAPGEISKLKEQLASRLVWGIVADVQLPDLETRMNIVEKKARARNVNVPFDTAQYIAECAQKDIRQLEGYLDRTLAYASLRKRGPELAIAKEALQSLEPQAAKITPEAVIAAVADHYNLSPTDLRKKSNAPSISTPRQVAWYLCRQLTDISYPELGKVFNGMHHSTVLYGVQKIESAISSDEALARKMQLLTEQLR